MKSTCALLLTLLLTGCHTFSGVMRSVNTDYVVDHQCVGDALRSVEGIHDVQYRYLKGGTPITLSGMQAADETHIYSYKVSDLSSNVYVRTNYKNKTDIAQLYGAYHGAPAQGDIDKIRPFMVKIEAAIKEKCKIEQIETRVKQTCSGVTCD